MANNANNSSPFFKGISNDQKIWVVTDPRPTSTLSDLVGNSTTLGGFMRVCVGGLSEDEHPALHLTKGSALRDAMFRCRVFKEVFAHLAEQSEQAYDLADSAESK